MNNTPEIDVNVDVLDKSLAPRTEQQLDIEGVLAIESVGEETERRTSAEVTKTGTKVSSASEHLTAEDINRVGNALGVPTDSTIEQLTQYLRRETEQLGMTIAKIGVGLAALKERLPYGEFEETVESTGLSSRRARECMQIAHFLAAQPDDRLRRFAELPKSKVLELAKAEPEVLDDYLNNHEDGEEPEGLSVRELRDHLRELRAKNEQVKDELLNKEMELETAKNELKAAGYERYKQSMNNVSPCYLEIREESYVTADIVLAGLNNLRRLYDAKLGPNCQLFSQPPNPRAYLDDDAQVAARKSAAATMYHHLAGAVGPVLRLIRELEESYPDAIGEATLAHMYSEEELELFKQNRDGLLAADDAARRRRDAERHNALTKGQRGRPKKVEE